jgi:FAD/FMN-containing dehydrogenase
MFDQFEAIVGAGNVFAGEGDTARYSEDGRGTGNAPKMVVRPRGDCQIIAVTRLANKLGIRLVPQGARTGLVGASVASMNGEAIILSLERHNQHIRIDPENRTATVDSGVSLSRLNDAAAQHGLFFPIDLGADPSVGGMIAANTGGARFLRYGDVRRNVLSVDCIAPDCGEIIRLGKGLWKDNSALDLKQCIIGSSGGLSIVTSATLALQPLPANRSGAILQLVDASRAVAILGRLEAEFGTLLTAFEGISANALRLALNHAPSLRRPFSQLPVDGYYLLIELSAPKAMAPDLLDQLLTNALAGVLEDYPESCVDAVVGGVESFWAIRHAIPAALRASGTVIACDISLPRGRVAEFREQAQALARQEWPLLILADFGHIGDGGLHFNFVWPHAEQPMPSNLKHDVQSAIFEKCVTEFGGSFSAEHGVGPSNIDFYHRFVPPQVRQLSAAVQGIFAKAPLGRVSFS